MVMSTRTPTIVAPTANHIFISTELATVLACLLSSTDPGSRPEARFRTSFRFNDGINVHLNTAFGDGNRRSFFCTKLRTCRCRHSYVYRTSVLGSYCQHDHQSHLHTHCIRCCHQHCQYIVALHCTRSILCSLLWAELLPSWVHVFFSPLGGVTSMLTVRVRRSTW